MKLTGGQVERFLKAPPLNRPIVLVYGADEGLVRERCEHLIASVLDDPRDPFRYAELSADAIRSESGRLLDEARALALTGGRRVVRVRQAGDLITAACRALVAIEPLEALILIDAGELAARSSLRRLLEGAANAAVIACYRDQGNELAAAIDRMLAEHNLRPDADARSYLVEHLGADRAVTQQELAKLALYLGGPDPDLDAGAGSKIRVTLEDVLAVVGDSAALSVDDLVHAVALGDLAGVERCLDRLLAEGQAPVRLVRALASHVARLHQFGVAVARGGSVDQVVERARPPVHFRRKGHVKRELRRWSIAACAAAQARLIDLEIGCKTTGRPAGLLCRRVFFELTRRAPAA